jgi:homocitrate synthase
MIEERDIVHHFKGVIDSTLREGFQFSRADFDRGQQKRIFAHLARIGVDYIEVGNPAQDAVRDMIRALVRGRRAAAPRVLCHIRNHALDVARSIECGVDGVNILCTVDRERVAAMNLTPAAYAGRLRENIAAARAASLEVRVGVEDAFGQDPEAGYALYGEAVAGGAVRIAAADTLGRSLSWDVYRRIRILRQRFAADIEVHFHNDLGHAVGNALAALRGGANYVSTSLLGIGERTGITPLSSLLANLYVLDADAVGRYALHRLTAAERYVARICGIDMPPHLMTNPANGFAHKAGIHLDALIKFGPQKYECLSPAVLGNHRNLILNTPISGKTRAADVRAFEERFGEASR